MQQYESEFLAAGARLGTWWVPDEADLHEGGLGSLPERSDVGIFTTAADGEWSLLLATALPSENRPVSDLIPRALMRRQRMWGKTRSSTISLFDATRTDWTTTNWTTDDKTYAETVWRGPWYVDSPDRWFVESALVDDIWIEIAAAGPWSDMPPGQGLKHNLSKQWDHERGIFSRPTPVVHDATVDDAAVQLCTGVRGHYSANRVAFELITRIRVTDEVEVSQVLEKWVEPLHDLVGIFWLKNPGIVSVSVQCPPSSELSRICYSGRFAPVEPTSVLDSAHTFAPFLTVECLKERGFSFNDLLTGYWRCRAQGYGRAIQRLNESQDSHLDQSLDARMLSTVKSLESYEKARTGRTGTINIAKAADNLLDTTGLIGIDIRDIWTARGEQLFKNGIARIRQDHLAHEQSGKRLKTGSDNELTDQLYHHVALQWLLRRRLLETIGIENSDADRLVADSLAYKNEIKVIRDYYEATHDRGD